MSEGLPNIKGSITLNKADERLIVVKGESEGDGALFPFGNWGYRISTSSLGGDSASPSFIGFDASRSSAVYGNNNTVQPPALSTQYLIKY